MGGWVSVRPWALEYLGWSERFRGGGRTVEFSVVGACSKVISWRAMVVAMEAVGLEKCTGLNGMFGLSLVFVDLKSSWFLRWGPPDGWRAGPSVLGGPALMSVMRVTGDGGVAMACGFLFSAVL